MEDIFATGIKINQVLNIKDFEIPLSETERRHLIITGKNGSGKTTLLNEIKESVSRYIVNEDNRIIRWVNLPINLDLPFNINFSDVLFKFFFGEFVIAFFGAKRNTELIAPTGINKVNLKNHYDIDDKARQDFIQYIVNLKADQSFASGENELEEVAKIDMWFKDFEEKILDIFDAKGAKLQFDRKTYNFNIVEPGKEPYNLNQLSDGYSAILNIVTELIMRMEEHKTKRYDVQGIVLIDEIETHLHIELQKKVLPFLTSFFPKIQFIVTTHSPFVINSIDNAVVCDLEKRIVLDNLSGYSYDAIVEGYFDADKYSTVLKQQVGEFEILMSKDGLNDEDNSRLQQLKKYLDGIPKFLSDELAVKLQQIKLKKLNKKV